MEAQPQLGSRFKLTRRVIRAILTLCDGRVPRGFSRKGRLLRTVHPENRDPRAEGRWPGAMLVPKECEGRMLSCE